MARVPLGNNRFIDIPDMLPKCNRYVVGADDEGMSILLISDDGTNALLIAAVNLEKTRMAGFVKAVVGAAETAGVEWESVQERRLPPQSGSAH